jgi:membrane protein YdbS with pleckstrin-like domain
MDQRQQNYMWVEEKPVTQQQQITNIRIVLRRSIFVIIIELIGLEFLFDLLYIFLRIIPMLFSGIIQIQGFLSPIYVFLFIILNIIKIILLITIALKWVTSSYTIAPEEIRHKTGILSHKEKVYSCKNMQEVIYTQGFWGRIFNFGSIEILNPAIREKIILRSIPNPEKYTEIIRKNFFSASSSRLISITA